MQNIDSSSHATKPDLLEQSPSTMTNAKALDILMSRSLDMRWRIATETALTGAANAVPRRNHRTARKATEQEPT